MDQSLQAAEPNGERESTVDLDMRSVGYRRALWELQTINGLSDRLAHSLELHELLDGALEHLCRAFEVTNSAVRLKDPLTGAFEVVAVKGDSGVRALWTANGGSVARPSDFVIASGQPVVIDDLASCLPDFAGEELPARSAVSVPMIAGDEMIGTLSVTAVRPARFTVADLRLLGSLAGQLGVAVQNARLHAVYRRGKQEWEHTFDAIADPIGVFDSNGILVRANQALASYMNCELRNVRGRTCGEVGFCGGGCPGCAVCRLNAHPSTSEITTADGRIFSVTTFPMTGSHHAAVVQVAKDVTLQITSARRLQALSEELAEANERSLTALAQLKNTQAQLLQAEKLSAIGELVAGVAHELNNPLTSVIGYAQLIQEELRETGGVVANPQTLTEDLQRITDESERAARIVRNLLSFARRHPAARALHQANDIFGRVLGLREYGLRSAGITLDTSFAADLPPIMADATQIQQALLNLILNAEQAMRGRPDCRLTVGTKYEREAAGVGLFVTDTGHGIAPADIGRIFDPFFTTREVGEGTGLGLSICYGIVRDHGGEIAVESGVNEGTTFTLLLPARLGMPDPPRVLVMHAPQGDHAAVATALAGWGYGVTAVTSSTEALERYLAEPCDLLLLEAALVAPAVADWRDARRRDTARAGLLMLGQNDCPEVERFAADEATAFIGPPFQLRTLRNVVCAAIAERV